MPDCFISYGSSDRRFAEYVRRELSQQHIDPFMAPASLEPGQNWSEAILANLRGANWVIALVSRSAAKSSYVNQEIGGALVASKKVVPVVWDMDPSELPGWLRNYQAIDLRACTLPELQAAIAALAKRINQDKVVGLVILAALVAGAVVVATQD